MAVVVVALTACTPAPESTPDPAASRSAADARPVSAPVISSTELFEVFIATCLKNFPSGEATKTAMNRSSLRTISYEPEDDPYSLGTFEDPKRRMWGGFGAIIYELSGDYDGGPLKRAECTVAAEITDPDRDWTALMALLSGRHPDVQWSSTGELSAEFTRDDAIFAVLIEPNKPGYTLENGTPRCADEDCGTWNEAVLSIGIIQ